jgi:hypothetical protein
MHVVENPNFPLFRFDPLADLFFAISDLLLKGLLLKAVHLKSHRRQATPVGGYSPPSKMFFDM